MAQKSRARPLPGAYPRRKRNGILLLYAGVLGCLTGLLAAYVLQMLGVWFQAAWQFAMATAGLLGLAALVFWIAMRTMELGGMPSWVNHVLARIGGEGVRAMVHKALMALDRYDKGEAGEIRVWESVTRALFGPSCAVAASVTEIPAIGWRGH